LVCERYSESPKVCWGRRAVFTRRIILLGGVSVHANLFNNILLLQFGKEQVDDEDSGGKDEPAVETKKLEAKNRLEKRAKSHSSAARCVGRTISYNFFNMISAAI